MPRKDLAGAVSLNSVSMNASRVIGPAIGGVLYALVGPSWVFVGNAVTYVAIMVAITRVTVPSVPKPPGDESQLSRARSAASATCAGSPWYGGRSPPC